MAEDFDPPELSKGLSKDTYLENTPFPREPKTHQRERAYTLVWLHYTQAEDSFIHADILRHYFLEKLLLKWKHQCQLT